MSYQSIIDDTKQDFDLMLSDFKQEMLKIRSGRLSPALLEDVEVNCFGSLMPLKQLGSITSAGLREVMVQLWDKSYVEGVVFGVEKAGLNLSLRIDGNKIYFTSPALTGEIREEMVRLLNKKKEEFYQQLRDKRDKAWKSLQNPEIREDDKFRGRDKLDEAARDYREKLEEIAKRKEEEIRG